MGSVPPDTATQIPAWVSWASGLSAPGAVLLSVTVLGRDRRARREHQARLVSAWAVEVTPLRAETDNGALITGGSGKSVRVAVRNASDAPVYDFHAWVRKDYAPRSGSMGSHLLHLLPPGESVVWADWVELPEGGLAGQPYVDLTFKDEHGRRWQRLHDGGLGPDRLSPEGRSARVRWVPRRVLRWWLASKYRRRRDA